MHSLNNIIQGAPEWSGGLQFDRCQGGGEPERVFNGMIQPPCQVGSHTRITAPHPSLRALVS